jgi:4,5-DOPA dioxygenase extradiol
MTTMPAWFVAHGSPMNALGHNRYTEAWRSFGEAMPPPRAILVVSAHWYINTTSITAMSRPKTIHDFSGFPDELFAVQYGAPGDPAFAKEVADLVEPERIDIDRDSWGLDHGTWSVLVHAFPKAEIPVLQLSINASKPFEYHFQLGAALAALRQTGVLIIGSGNVVHNLRGLDWNQPDTGFDWAHRFDEAAMQIMTESPSDVLRLPAHPDFAKASPTPDHFLPLLYAAGLASAAGEPARVLVDGYALGSLSMTSYTVGCRAVMSEPTLQGTLSQAQTPRAQTSADETDQ